MNVEEFNIMSPTSIADLENTRGCLMSEVMPVDKGRNYEQIYRDYRFEKGIDWEDLTADLSEKFAFLKAFATQGLKTKQNFEFYSETINRIVSEHSSIIGRCKSETLEDYPYKEEFVMLLGDFLTAFFNIGQGFRFVAGSKFLHMHFPDLFFILDSVIVKKLIPTKAVEYYEGRMDGMYLDIMQGYQRDINQVLSDIEKQKGMNRSEAVAYLKSQDHSQSIPRIIDKYYYNV